MSSSNFASSNRSSASSVNSDIGTGGGTNSPSTNSSSPSSQDESTPFNAEVNKQKKKGVNALDARQQQFSNPGSFEIEEKSASTELTISSDRDTCPFSLGTSSSISSSPTALMSPSGAGKLMPPPLSLSQQIFISAYWFGWSFLWLALLVVVIPTQIAGFSGASDKGLALSGALFFGALVSVFATPLFGSLSDTRSPTAWLGKRKAFMVIGSLFCSLALIVMAFARDVFTIGAGFFLLSLSNNVIMAPYVALVPDLTPPSQRGSTSGWLGTFSMAGYLCAGAVTFNLSGIGVEMVYLILGFVHLLTLAISVLYVREYSFIHQAYEDQDAGKLHSIATSVAASAAVSTAATAPIFQSDLISASPTKRASERFPRGATPFSQMALSPHEESNAGSGTLPVRSLPSQAPFSTEEMALCGDIELQPTSRREPKHHGLGEKVHEDKDGPTTNSRDSAEFSFDPLDTFRVSKYRAETAEERKKRLISHFITSGLTQKTVLQRMKSFLEPFRAKNFRMVFISRFLVQMGIITVQEYIQFFLADVFQEYRAFGVLLASNAEQAVSIVFIPVLVGALFASVVAGFASDSQILTRKAQLLLSGGFMSSACLAFAFVTSYSLCLICALFFGLGYGMFSVLDWTIVTEALPKSRSHATDMGTWSLSLVFPQVLATPIAGLLLDNLNKNGGSLGYTVMFITTSVYIIAGLWLINFVSTAHGLVPPTPEDRDSNNEPGSFPPISIGIHNKFSNDENSIEVFGCTGASINITAPTKRQDKMADVPYVNMHGNIIGGRFQAPSEKYVSHNQHNQHIQSQNPFNPPEHTMEYRVEEPRVSNNPEFEIDDEDDLANLDAGDVWNSSQLKTY